MRSGAIRALAVSAAARSPLAPEVPTLQEAFPAAEVALETIIAALAPARTPPAAVGRLDGAIRSALARPALQQRFAALATAALPLAAGELDRRIRSDNARWEALIRQAGIEPELQRTTGPRSMRPAPSSGRAARAVIGRAVADDGSSGLASYTRAGEDAGVVLGGPCG